MIEIKISKTLNGQMGKMKLELDFEVKRNQITAIYGPSGAGKTTLLNIIAGLVKPDSGKITVNGKTWLDTSKKQVLPPKDRNIAYVFQDYALFPNMTVEENIRFATQKNTDVNRVEELIKTFELQDLKNQKPIKLSGGQQQRVALARALAQEPNLLLLDEPLAALDYQIRSRLQDYLLEIQEKFALTILLVSHDIGEIHKLANQVVCLQDGRIKKSGSPMEVFVGERLQNDFSTSVRILFIDKEKQQITVLANHENVVIDVSKDEVENLKVGDYIMLSFSVENVKVSRVVKAY